MGELIGSATGKYVLMAPVCAEFDSISGRKFSEFELAALDRPQELSTRIPNLRMLSTPLRLETTEGCNHTLAAGP